MINFITFLVVLAVAVLGSWIMSRLFFKKLYGQVKDVFKSLSLDIMERNTRTFIDLAKTVFENYHERTTGEVENRRKEVDALISPMKESLEKFDKSFREIERQRVEAYASLNRQLQSLITSENLLRNETANLTSALKSPNIRGAWGQLHLKRVVEIAGLLENCDFFEQPTYRDGDKICRPDLVVKLPGERQIIVDAKTPLDAYLKALNLEDEDQKKRMLKEHTNHLRQHMKDLSSKKYWKNFSLTPEYVILFLPAEAFFSVALQEDPTLIEYGARRNIVIATPTTLIAILKAVAYGWTQEKISRSTEEIGKIGRELYERIGQISVYLVKLGKNLSTSVDAYNLVVSSLDTKILPTARKLKKMGVSMEDLEKIESIDKKIAHQQMEKIELHGDLG